MNKTESKEISDDVLIAESEKKENRRIGIAKGFFGNIDLETFNSMNEEIEKEFYGEQK